MLPQCSGHSARGQARDECHVRRRAGQGRAGGSGTIGAESARRVQDAPGAPPKDPQPQEPDADPDSRCQNGTEGGEGFTNRRQKKWVSAGPAGLRQSTQLSRPGPCPRGVTRGGPGWSTADSSAEAARRAPPPRPSPPPGAAPGRALRLRRATRSRAANRPRRPQRRPHAADGAGARAGVLRGAPGGAEGEGLRGEGERPLAARASSVPAGGGPGLTGATRGWRRRPCSTGSTTGRTTTAATSA